MFENIAHNIPHHTIVYRGVQITIKRLDLVHPQISGNKFFKLKYNFLEAERRGVKKILTFGGAYSNHIAATAYAAHIFGFESVGIIRGEELAHTTLNPTLHKAQHFGMHLNFVSRQDYRHKQHPEYLTQLQQQFPEHYVIPEGGTNALAIQGCTEILQHDDREQFEVICCAVGTGGMLTGLIEASDKKQLVMGFSALKGDFLAHELKSLTSKTHWQISDQYCCGGYAKTTPELLTFMEQFEASYHIPLEQIYTGKMMLGIFDMIDQALFKPNQRLLVIHSGGLQGKLNSQSK